MSWLAPAWIVGPLLLSVVLLIYLQYILVNVHLPAAVLNPLSNAVYAMGRILALSPMLVATVGVVYREPERREDWRAVFRVALMMTGAQWLMIVLRQVERNGEVALFQVWYHTNASQSWLHAFEVLDAALFVFNAALWVRFCLLLPMMARGEVFPLKAAWDGMRGCYLSALLVSFITMGPWYAAESVIQRYIIGPMAAGMLPRDPFHFAITLDRVLLFLAQGAMAAFSYLLQAALSAWLLRVVTMRREATAPSP